MSKDEIEEGALTRPPLLLDDDGRKAIGVAFV